MARWRTEEEEKRYAAARAAERADYENQAAKDAAYEIGYNEGAKAAVDKYDVENRTTTPAPVRTTTTTTPAATAPATKEKASPSLVSEDYLKQFLDRDEFSYDQNADPAWQAYKNQYMTLGRQAAMDTYGKTVALTGGYGNSYAQGVSQQVENEYAARAADKVPELYAAALDRYDRQGQEILNKYSILNQREAAANEEAWREREWGFTLEQFEFTKEKFGKEYALQVADQILKEKVAEHDMSVEDARLILDQLKTQADIDLGYRNYALSEKKANADIDLGYRSDARADRELTARIDNSYYAPSNSSNTKNDAAEAASLGMTEAELAAYKAKFTGSVKLDTDEKWSSALNKVVVDLKRGTFDESSLYKYTYDQAMALFDRAEAMAKNSIKPKNTVSQGTK